MRRALGPPIWRPAWNVLRVAIALWAQLTPSPAPAGLSVWPAVLHLHPVLLAHTETLQVSDDGLQYVYLFLQH